MIAKCGPRVMHHWAHTGRRNCDPWWENETQWHREWKNLFPESYREVSHTAPDGEIHRADIKTPKGIVIEIQHSSMTDAERISRESFYKNLVWIIDGSVFRQNFDIQHPLPPPDSNLAKDLVWVKAKRGMLGTTGGCFFRWSEGYLEKPGSLYRIHSFNEIKEQIHQEHLDHYQYSWIRPRRTWLDAVCPVFIDLGNDLLAKLEIYDSSGLQCIRLISKKKLVHDAMVEDTAQAIASRFYPVASAQTQAFQF